MGQGLEGVAPKAKELFLDAGGEGFKPTGVWFCGTCRVVWGPSYLNGAKNTQEAAEACCAPSACECSAAKPKGYIRCDACQSKLETSRTRDRIAKAEKLESWDGWVADPNDNGPNEGYFESLEALMEWYNEQGMDGEEIEIPEFAFATTVVPFTIGIESCISSALEEHYEDAGEALIDEAGIVQAVKEWEARQEIKSFQVDYSRVIRIPRGESANPQDQSVSP